MARGELGPVVVGNVAAVAGIGLCQGLVLLESGHDGVLGRGAHLHVGLPVMGGVRHVVCDDIYFVCRLAVVLDC